MSGYISLYGKNVALASMFMPEQPFPIDRLWVAVTSTTPAPSSVGFDLREVSGGGYQRAPYFLGKEYWEFIGWETIYNTQYIEFPPATSAWGLMSGWALCTEADEGMTVLAGSLNMPIQIEIGDILVIPPSCLTVRIYD